MGKVGAIRKRDLRGGERGKTDPLANKSAQKKWIGNKNGQGRPKKTGGGGGSKKKEGEVD